MERNVYRLSDSVIAKLVQLFQLGVLTGTDIADHFRQVVVEPSSLSQGKLELTPEYVEAEGKNIEKLLEQAAALEVEQAGDEQLN